MTERKELTVGQREQAQGAADIVRAALLQLRAVTVDLCQIDHPEETHLVNYALEGIDIASAYLQTYEQRALTFVQMTEPCPRCEGARKRLRPGDDECWVCEGRGSVTKQVFDVQSEELDL